MNNCAKRLLVAGFVTLFVTIASKSSNAETIEVSANLVANSLSVAFRNTIIILNGSRQDWSRSGQLYGTYQNNATRGSDSPWPVSCSDASLLISEIVFEQPLSHWIAPLKTREIRVFTITRGSTVPGSLPAVDVAYLNFGHNCWEQVSVTPEDDHFLLRFRMNSGAGEITRDCRWVDNNRVDVSGDSISSCGGVRQISWSSPRISIRLEPYRRHNRVGFRAREVRITGRIQWPFTGTCSGGLEELCHAQTNRFLAEAADRTQDNLGKSIVDAINSDRIQNFLAVFMLNPLGVFTRNVVRAKMCDGSFSLELSE